MDKRLIAERFARARGTYTREAKVQLQVAEKMLQLVEQHRPDKELQQVMEFGCGTGIYSHLIVERLHPARLLLNDLCPEMEELVRSLPARFLAGDAEVMSLPAGTELITSCSTLQWFVSPSRFFQRCQEALTEGGLLAISTFGPENLREIRSLTGNGLTYPTLAELKQMLQAAHLQLLHGEEEEATLTFTSPLEVLRHLQRTGATGTGTHIWTRGKLQRFENDYRQSFALPEGVSLTYHPIYLIAQKNKNTSL